MSKHGSCCCMDDEEEAVKIEENTKRTRKTNNSIPPQVHKPKQSAIPDCSYCLEVASVHKTAIVTKRDKKTSCITCECSTPTCASCFVFKPKVQEKDSEEIDSDSNSQMSNKN